MEHVFLSLSTTLFLVSTVNHIKACLNLESKLMFVSRVGVGPLLPDELYSYLQ